MAKIEQSNIDVNFRSPLDHVFGILKIPPHNTFADRDWCGGSLSAKKQGGATSKKQ
jgi:hypothetical protein